MPSSAWESASPCASFSTRGSALLSPTCSRAFRTARTKFSSFAFSALYMQLRWTSLRKWASLACIRGSRRSSASIATLRTSESMYPNASINGPTARTSSNMASFLVARFCTSDIANKPIIASVPIRVWLTHSNQENRPGEVIACIKRQTTKAIKTAIRKRRIFLRLRASLASVSSRASTLGSYSGCSVCGGCMSGGSGEGAGGVGDGVKFFWLQGARVEEHGVFFDARKDRRRVPTQGRGDGVGRGLAAVGAHGDADRRQVLAGQRAATDLRLLRHERHGEAVCGQDVAQSGAQSLSQAAQLRLRSR